MEKKPITIEKKPSKVKKIFKYLLIAAVVFVVLFFVLTVVTYYFPTMENKPDFSQYLTNSILMFITPSESMWHRAHFYTNSSSVNYWDQYNNKSLFWLKMSAIFGGSPSQCELGGYYFFKKKDMKSAIYWMEKAATDKTENSYYSYKPKLALLYCQEGEYKNEEKALALYKECGEFGNKRAMEDYLLLLSVLHPDEYRKTLSNIK